MCVKKIANGGKTAAIVILSIISLGELGLSGYMFVEDQFLGGNEYIPDQKHNNRFKLNDY